MSKHYAASEEILYHVGFSAQQLQGATVAVLPGDPGRVEPLAKALGSDASFIASHREYTSWLTKISDTPVLVCSTGMGGPSVAICLEELARMASKSSYASVRREQFKKRLISVILLLIRLPFALTAPRSIMRRWSSRLLPALR